MEKLKEKERELKKKKVQKSSYQRNKTVSTFRGGRDRDKDRNRTANNSKIYQENKSMGHFLRKDKALNDRKKIDLKYITFTPRRGEEKSKSFLISKTDARTEVERNKKINEKKLITNLSIKGREERQKSKSKGKVIKKEEKKEEKKVDIKNKNSKRSSRISFREKEKDKKDSKKDIKKEEKTKMENKNKSKFEDKKEIKNIDKYKKRESKIKEEKKEIPKLVKKEVKKDYKKVDKKEDSKIEEKKEHKHEEKEKEKDEIIIETKAKLEENLEKEKIDDKNVDKKEEKTEIKKEEENIENNVPIIEKEIVNQHNEDQGSSKLENKEETKEKEDPKKRLSKYFSEKIIRYLNYEEIKTLLILSKDSAKSIIPFLKELNQKNLQESENDLNKLKSNNNEDQYKADIFTLKLSKASIKALEKLNEEEYQKLFISEKEPDNRDITLIYRLFLQLLNKSDNRIKEQKDKEFWVLVRDKLFVKKEGNFGDYIKALIEQIDFSKENLKEVNDFCKIYKDKLNQKYISSLCHTTGLFFVFIRDILDYCGIFESNKACLPLNYQRLEYNYNFILNYL